MAMLSLVPLDIGSPDLLLLVHFYFRRLEELMRVNNPKQPTTLDESEIKACTTADERREVKRAKEVATQETVS